MYPSFREFLNSLDMEKLAYDIGANSTKSLNGPAPLSAEQIAYISDMIFAETTAILGLYHAWLISQPPLSTPGTDLGQSD